MAGLRNFDQLTMELLRSVNVPIQRATVYDARQAVNDSYREITQFADWNFLIDRYDIPLVPSYTTGTVTVALGSTTVTANAAAVWNAGWFNRKILLTGDTAEKEIVSFQFVGGFWTATLRYPFNSPIAPLAGLSYTIFEDSYPVPCAPGRDLVVLNPLFQWSKLDKLDRYTFDVRTAFNRFQTGIRPSIYTEDGVDWNTTSPNYQQVKFQFWPKPTAAQDLILRYFRNVPSLVQPTDRTVLPPEFDEVLIRLGTYRLRRKFGVPGWAEDHTVAMRMLLQFREKNNTATAADFQPGSSLYPYSDSWAIDTAMPSWPGRIG